MKASIVIPAHNEEKSLPKTLEAALKQNYHWYEVIVVDNASTDNTTAVASRYPVKVVYEPRKGLLWARERGRLEADGDIIANMDADCLPSEDWISRGLSNFRNQDIVAVTGPYDYHDAGPAFRLSSLWTQKILYRLTNRLLQLPGIRKGAILIGGNNLIRAEALRRAGGYNTDIAFYGEDTDTAKRVSRYGRVVFDPRLAMKTSARRMQAEGIVRLSLRYWRYFLKHIFSKA